MVPAEFDRHTPVPANRKQIDTGVRACVRGCVRACMLFPITLQRFCFPACYQIKIMNSDNTKGSDGALPPDQYADGVAATLPNIYCRTPAYKQWLSSVVGGRGYKTVLDAACGNGCVVAVTKSGNQRHCYKKNSLHSLLLLLVL